MPRASTDSNPFRGRFFTARMKKGRIIPVISNKALLKLVLGDYESLVTGYVDHSKYPLKDRDDLHKMAKFRSIYHPEEDSEPWGHFELGEDYLNYVKGHLLMVATRDRVHPDTLRIACHEQEHLSPSGFADRLGYPAFSVLDDEKKGPLELLVELQLPIFLTTSYHTFIETALKKAGKEPRSDFCRWHSDQDDYPSVFDGDYTPSKEQPLVYHLHGLDTREESLVLAEDDCLDFLVAVTRDEGNDIDRIPDYIRAAMKQSALVLLGFELHSWAFRVFLWGLIKGLQGHRKGLIALQIAPDEVEQAFLRRYFDHEASLDILWGSVPECIQKLDAQWGT